MSEASPLALAIALAAAVFFFFGVVAQDSDHYQSDFYSFWAGSRLIGPDLYKPEAAQALQQAESPRVKGKSFIRPPFYAVALWPLGRLPFHSAFLVWQLLNITALLVAVGLWRFQPSSYAACALFPPIWSCFGLSQDAPILLLIAVAAIVVIRRGRDLLGGAVLALFVAKPNLVPLIPFLLLIQRRYRALTGFLAGGIALYLISSVAVGFNWLVGYSKAVFGNEGTIYPRIPGLAGLFTLCGLPQWTVYLALPVGGFLVFRYARNADWSHAMTYTLAVAVVFAPRSMMYDLVLLFPLLLLTFTPWITIGLGFALITIVFGAWGIIARLVAIALCWAARPKAAAIVPQEQSILLP